MNYIKSISRQYLKYLILLNENLHLKMIVNQVENLNHQIGKADVNNFHLR